jgi:hypothetical protein
MRNLILALLVICSLNLPAWAVLCNICQDDIAGEPFICPTGHTTCAECVNEYVGSLLGNPSAVDELHKKGLKCFHAELPSTER